MNRRGFFGRMIGAVVAAKVAPQVTAVESFDVAADSVYTVDRLRLMNFYQLTASNPYINQRELLKRIEGVTLK